MGSDKKVPQIRFEGFEGEWESKLLGDLMEVTSVKRIHQSDWTDRGVRFIRARDIVAASKGEKVTDILYITKIKYDEYSALSGKVKIDDVLVTGVGSIGVPMLIENDEPLYFKDGNVIWFRNNVLNGSFFYYIFGSENIQKYINGVAGVGTVGTYTIDSGKKTPIQYPIDKTEQTTIGNFFRYLDDTITLKKQQYEQTVNIKKAMLEKMFPKKGADVPEIRFEGFTGAWEGKRFDSIIERITSLSNNQTLPNVEFEDIISGCGVLNKNIYDKPKKKIGIEFCRGDILFGKLRPYLKNWLLAYFSGIAIGDFWVLRPIENDNNFVYALMQTCDYQYVANLSTGTKMPRSEWSVVSETIFRVPLLPEQIAIGNFFRNLDTLITAQQQELDKLQNIKKALLDKMFV